MQSRKLKIFIERSWITPGSKTMRYTILRVTSSALPFIYGNSIGQQGLRHLTWIYFSLLQSQAGEPLHTFIKSKKKKIHENLGWVSRGFISQCPKSTFATAMNEQDNLWKYEKLSQWDLSWEKLFDFFTPTFCIRKTFLRATNKIYLCDGGQNCLRNWKKMDLSPRWSFKLKSISESIDFKFYPSEWIFYWMLSDESLYLNKYIK